MSSPNYLIREYPLQQGALEIAYIEEFFNEFPDAQVRGRDHLAARGARVPDPDGRGAAARRQRSTVVPVSYKVSHELRAEETDPKLADLVDRLRRHGRLRRTTGALQLAGRDPARLARPGPLPRAHRRAGSLGRRPGLRHDRRQDEEPLLRHARHARQPAVQRHQARAGARSARLEGLPRQAARAVRARRASQPASGHARREAVQRPGPVVSTSATPVTPRRSCRRRSFPSSVDGSPRRRAPSRSVRASCPTVRRRRWSRPSRRFGGDARRSSLRPGRRAARRSSSAIERQARARERHRRPARESRRGHGRRQPGVHERRAGDCRHGRRDHPAGAVLLQSRDGDRDGRRHGRCRCRPGRLPARPRRHRARHHAAHAGGRDRVAEQSRPAPCTPRRRCVRSTRSAASAASSTSTTRPTSTSPTAASATSRRDRSTGAGRHTISLYSLSKAYGMASWRIGLHGDPRGALGRGQQDSGHAADLCAVGVAGRGRRGARRRPPPTPPTRLDGLDADAPAHARGRSTRPAMPCDVPLPDGAFYFFVRVRSAHVDPMALTERLDPRTPRGGDSRVARSATRRCSIRVSYGALDAGTVAEGLGRLVDGLRALAATSA